MTKPNTNLHHTSNALEAANLTPKQRRFVRAYLPPEGNFNATEAARRAGYAWPGKSGPRVSRSPKVRLLVQLWFARRRRSRH